MQSKTCAYLCFSLGIFIGKDDGYLGEMSSWILANWLNTPWISMFINTNHWVIEKYFTEF